MLARGANVVSALGASGTGLLPQEGRVGNIARCAQCRNIF